MGTTDGGGVEAGGWRGREGSRQQEGRHAEWRVRHDRGGLQGDRPHALRGCRHLPGRNQGDLRLFTPVQAVARPWPEHLRRLLRARRQQEQHRRAHGDARRADDECHPLLSRKPSLRAFEVDIPAAASGRGQAGRAVADLVRRLLDRARTLFDRHDDPVHAARCRTLRRAHPGQRHRSQRCGDGPRGRLWRKRSVVHSDGDAAQVLPLRRAWSQPRRRGRVRGGRGDAIDRRLP